MITIKSFTTNDQKNFKEVRKIREVVFIQEQQVEEQDEFDEFEDESLHYLIYKNDKSIGTARWRIIGERVKLERFAVLKEARRQGFGEVLVKRVITDAVKENKTMYLHAQLSAMTLYERVGFQKIGELFSECDIDHYKMEYVG